MRTSNGPTPSSADALGSSSPNPLDAFDPLGSRLHDIGGLIIEFYAVKQRMPTSLDQLKSLAGPAESAELVEPGTGQPFVYLPQAARMSAGDKRIVCYAPTPAVSSGGSNWYQALLVQLGRPGQHSAAWVVTIPEIELQAHMGSAAPTSQPTQ